MKQAPILRVATKVLVPLMLLFALYVQFHGELGPGGGFQAGVIIAASVVIYGLVFGLEAAQRVVPPILIDVLMPLGVAIYAGTGLLGLVLGRNYLNYSPLGRDQVHGQELGISLIELGVATTVASVMIAIFYYFAGRGR
jgi:multicomponent Na+:H+ antiporter subunit B